jgi:ribosome-binding ATPase YchF (GTP1/OBG family)
MQCQQCLSDGKNIRSLNFSKEDRLLFADLCFLTDKPVLYVANVDEAFYLNRQ